MANILGLLGASGFLVFLLVSLILMGLSLKYNELIKVMFLSLLLTILCLVSVVANAEALKQLKDHFLGNNPAAIEAPPGGGKTEVQEQSASLTTTSKQGDPSNRLALDQAVEKEVARVKDEIDKLNNPHQDEPQQQERKNEQVPVKADAPKMKDDKPAKQDTSTNRQTAPPQAENVTQDADGTLIIKRGQQLKADTVNITNNKRSRMVVYTNTAIGMQVNGIVTSLDGKGNPVVTKTEKPFFSPVQNSPDAEVTVDPSYAGGLRFLPGEGGPYQVYIRAAPYARTGEYMAYVNFQWADDIAIGKYTLTDKEYRFRIVP